MFDTYICLGRTEDWFLVNAATMVRSLGTACASAPPRKEVARFNPTFSGRLVAQIKLLPQHDGVDADLEKGKDEASLALELA
jgi:hypothetical protein